MKMKQNGFSLVELVVGLTILGFISVAVGTSFLNIFSNQQNVSNQSDINGMDRALKNYLQTDTFCNASLKGLPLPSSERPLTIKNFSGFGKKIDLKTNTEISESVRMFDVKFKLNTSSPAVKTYFNGKAATARLADITYGFQYRKAYSEGSSSKADWINKKTQSVTLPVKLVSGVIATCDSANSPESVCAATGGKWANGVCEPLESCEIKGTFIIWKCDGIRSEDLVCGNTFVGALTSKTQENASGNYTIAAQGGTLRKYKTSGSVSNPMTGSASCPKDSRKTYTGRDYQTFTLDCGKKCTYTVTQTANFYTCRKCDGD